MPNHSSQAGGSLPGRPAAPGDLGAAIEKPEVIGVWPGSGIDWSAPHAPIRLYVELPFWLMMPEGTIAVTHGVTTINVAVVHGCEEIQGTATQQITHASALFVARPHEPVPTWVQDVVERSSRGYSVRFHRTTLILETTALVSVLRVTGDGRAQVNRHAPDYLRALVVGHLPFVNALITAYRRAGYDPFVQEVTEATVPVWFVRLEDRFLRVSVYPYADHERRPEWPIPDGPRPAAFATNDEVIEYLALPETPGEAVLLDAWSYFYAGRFGDAVRGLVTAVEVLLEARYAEALRRHGRSDEQVQAALRATATKFTTRLNEYQRLTGRTVPGPLLSYIPWVNGVRLRAELNDTRTLRHRIVHEGHRVSPTDYGPMLRAAETMTWLFDWLDDTPRHSPNRFKLYSLKGALKGRVAFGVEYTGDGVRVQYHEPLPPAEATEPVFADDQLWAAHARALFGEGKDLALFVKMSLACVRAADHDIEQVFMAGGTTITDHDLPNPATGVTPERFRCDLGGLFTAVFVLELDGEVTAADLSGVLIRLSQLRVEFVGRRVHGLCVADHQRYLAPASRQTYRHLDSGLTALLESCDLSLVLAADLGRNLTAARAHNWSLIPLRDALTCGGYCPCSPPWSAVVGAVVRVFPKQQVLGVDVNAVPDLKGGDRLHVPAAAGYEVLTVESIEVDRQRVGSVASGLAGVKVGGSVERIAEGAPVFRSEGPAVTPGEPTAAAAPPAPEQP